MKLPMNFSICERDIERVRVTRSSQGGEFLGEVIEYSPYIGATTDKMVWFDSDVKRWLEKRTIPATRPADHMKKSLARMGLKEWDLEELILMTRGFFAYDGLWVRLAEWERFEVLSPRYHDEVLPYVHIDDKGVCTGVDFPEGCPQGIKDSFN